MSTIVCVYPLVVSALVANGDNQDEVTPMGRLRTTVLRHLSALQPLGTLSVQRLALEAHKKQPSLVLFLALDQAERAKVQPGEGGGAWRVEVGPEGWRWGIASGRVQV